MPTELSRLARDIDPPRTVLLFGSGASIPSGAPSISDLQKHFEKAFGVSATNYTLAEQTGIIEHRSGNRAAVIESLRSQFKGLKPSGALLNLPLYNWKNLFTTNWDDLIEDCYARRRRSITPYTTNFDFGIRSDPASVQLFKLHGTIGKDIAFGDKSRIILTDADYDSTEEYREALWDRLRADLPGSHLIIIGNSLADPDIRSVVNKALALNAKAGGSGRISLLLYTPDEGRADLFESHGLTVSFGSIDDFFAGLVRHIVAEETKSASEDPLDSVVALRPATEDVIHSLKTRASDVSSMYNGWPASFSDIAAGLTFRRLLSDQIELQLTTTDQFISVILGASGVGKTTAARQVLAALVNRSIFAWEHKSEQALLPSKWREVAHFLAERKATGALLIDDAHGDLPGINELVDFLSSDKNTALKIIIVATSRLWAPRVKTPNIFSKGKTYVLSQIAGKEIDRLLTLIDSKPKLRALVEAGFAGFSIGERRRRLIQRCDADMFVCLKNIFSSDKLDDIILREYADLHKPLQDIYRIVAVT